MADIKNAVEGRNGTTEIHVIVGDKIFVLFAYSGLRDRSEYKNDIEHKYSFVALDNSLKKALAYCKKHFPGKIINTVPIGTGVQNERDKNTRNSVKDRESWILSTAKEVGVEVKIIMNKENE